MRVPSSVSLIQLLDAGMCLDTWRYNPCGNLTAINQGTTESSKKQKLFLMNWCPDSAKIKKKMLYASSFDNLKKSLVGVHKFIQVRLSN